MCWGQGPALQLSTKFRECFTVQLILSRLKTPLLAISGGKWGSRLCHFHTLPLATLTPLIARSLILKRLAVFGNGPNIVKTSQSLIDRSSLVAGAGGLAPVALLVRLLALRPVDVGVGPASHVSILYNIVKPCLHV